MLSAGEDAPVNATASTELTTWEEIMRKRRFLFGLSSLVLAATVFGCATLGGGGDWVTLLDGSMPKTMDNWAQAGDQANWRIVDGAVQADKGGKGSSHLVSKESYRDFQLRAEFWA